MKLWAWFITSSHNALTRVRGYSRWIFGIMASNCEENNDIYWQCHSSTISNQRVNITHLFLALLSEWKLILASQIACILLIIFRVGFTTSCYFYLKKQNILIYDAKRGKRMRLDGHYTTRNMTKNFESLEHNLLDSQSALVWFRSTRSRTNWQMENRRQPRWQA